jgi:hypothetical protein
VVDGALQLATVIRGRPFTQSAGMQNSSVLTVQFSPLHQAQGCP